MSRSNSARTPLAVPDGDESLELAAFTGDVGRRLTDARLEELFEERGTPQMGRQRVRHIRDNLPGRATRSSRFAGKLRYPSQKMGFVLEAEAFATEFVAIMEWEFDPACYEMYAQPDDRLKITYKNKNGRAVTTLIRPDAFRVTEEAFVFTECKMEPELEKLAAEQPARFIRTSDGNWRSPPAEEAAEKLGCRFEIRSSAQNNYVLHNNLVLLHDYFTKPLPEVSASAVAALAERMKGKSFISAYELVHMEPRIDADDLYMLMLQGAVYYPLTRLPLEDQDRALFFKTQDEWRAHEIFVSVDKPLRRADIRKRQYRAGDTFTWNGVVYQVLNPGKLKLSCRSADADGRMILLKYEEISALEDRQEVVFDGRYEEAGRTSAEDRFNEASPEDIKVAMWRYQVLDGSADKSNPLKGRSDRARAYWAKSYREAEELYGNGLVGLLRQRPSGRRDKAAPASKALALEFIENEWETIRRKQRLHVFGSYSLECKKRALDAVSYVSFCRYVKERAGHKQEVARVGEKAAYDEAPQYLELEYTTPRHGLHSWHIGHIDHTPLPLKFLHSRFAEFADTVWLSMIHGSHDRKVRGYYLSFDEPSYRSNMMVIRDCVRRYGRMFQTVIADQGPEFQSAYYETQLGRLKSTKRERPAGKPHFGSTCERMFKTTQTQFVTNLLGSTDIVEEYFRAVSPEVDPRNHAVWILDKFDAGLDRFFDEVFHPNHHGGIDMSPNAAEALSLRSHGERKFQRFSYDEKFIALSCPAVKRGTVKVTAQGVKINYRWFKTATGEMDAPGVMHTRIPARYDPDNSGLAYVYMSGKWIRAYSEHYALFSHMSERALGFATKAWRVVARRRNEKLVANAENLAQFALSMEGQEAIARQQRNDVESAKHREKILGPAKPVPTVERTSADVIPLRGRSPSARPASEVNSSSSTAVPSYKRYVPSASDPFPEL